MKRLSRGAILVSILLLVFLAGTLLALAQGTEPSDELEEFVPTERVAADRAVSFPVDI